jgi:hypothetical protein
MNKEEEIKKYNKEEAEIKKDNEEEAEIKKDKEERRKKKEERKRQKKYNQMINYPNMNVEMQVATEPDSELFNNIFDENQVICQNNVKRYIYCSTIFILYGIIGFMYYTYIY